MTPYILIVICVIFSAFFSGSEIAYASVNKVRLRRRAEEGGMLDKLSLSIYENYDQTLISILIGNNLVNIGSSSIATVIATGLMGDEGAWVATFIITVLILMFGEIMPKIVASRKNMGFTKLAAMPLKIVMIVTFPLVWLFGKLLGGISKIWKGIETDDDAITEDDLETILDTVEDEGVVDEDICDMLQSALDFGDVLAYEIITPRVDMLAIDIDDPAAEQRAELLGCNFSRVPVYKDTVDNIIGVVNLNKYLMAAVADDNVDIRTAMAPPLFVHKTMPISDVLALMKKEKKHMVIVTDEYGGTAGVLTMEDILEQIVGDIWDEHDDVRPEFECIGQDFYRADGDMRILDLFEELDVDDRDFDDDNATVGGWVIEMLGDYADVGDTFNYRNLTVTVTEIENLRVLGVTVHVEPLPEDEDEEEF